MNNLNLTDTAIVMEIPSPVKEQIEKLRQKFDPILAENIPAEITIAGSSGLGTIAPGQDGHKIVEMLKQIAASTKAFRVSLGKVVNFTNSSVYAFSVIPQVDFFMLHEMLKTSNIRFNPSIYPFYPHCSIHIWGMLSPEKEEEIMKAVIEEEFLLSSIAIYQLVEGKAAVLVRRFNLDC